jgi:hypothetical protein
VINVCGELLAVVITPGKVDDRQPVPQLSWKLFGKLFGGRGCISQELFKLLYEQGVQLITKLKKNMKNKLQVDAIDGQTAAAQTDVDRNGQ